MALLGERPLIRRRYGTGSRGSDGRWSRGTSTDTPFRGAIQDRGSKRRDVTPDGTRQSDFVTLLVAQRSFLRVEDDKAATPVEADEVVDCETDEVYKVVSARNDGGLITHQQCDLLRLREGPR